MVPLIVMGVVWAAMRAAGAAGLVDAAATWTGALRFALAAMFVFTAASHFLPRIRPDLVRMVPPGLPNPALLVSLTGICELAGAVGLLVPPLVSASAWALIVMLVGMFPANVRAARSHQMIAGRPATPLAIRLPMQLFWIGALWQVARHA
jgi:uncharacterized membrane protein